MKSFLSLRVFLASGVLALGIVGSGWAAETKAPAKKSSKSSPEEAPVVEVPNDAAEKIPLKLAVDRKPLNRDAADRVSYAPIVKRTASSVVYVHSSKTVKAQDIMPFLNDPMLRKFFEQLPGGPGSGSEDGSGGSRKGGRIPHSQPQVGLGSGVVITPDGYILTNNHVIEGADEVKVSIGESTKKYEVKIVGRDSFADIAVLKIEPTAPLTPATLGDSEQLQVGDVVLAIGNPFGVGQSVSRGIVSALSRGDVGIGGLEDFIQTDAAINPGNSGGALLDTEGRLVGINTAILSRSGGFNGVGFAIPINLVRNVAEQIVNTGRVSRGFLGVSMQNLDEQLSAAFKTEQGAIITEVSPDSPAEKAGLQPGDIITRIDSTEIRDMRHVLLTVGQLSPETEVKIDYLRDGKAETATLKLARRPDQTLADIDAAPSDVGVLNGVTVAEITPEVREQIKIPANIRGAIVTDVEPSSPSSRAGIQEGDVILDLNGRLVRNAAEAVRLSEEIPGPLVRVYIWRDGAKKYIGVDESKK